MIFPVTRIFLSLILTPLCSLIYLLLPPLTLCLPIPLSLFHTPLLSYSLSIYFSTNLCFSRHLILASLHLPQFPLSPSILHRLSSIYLFFVLLSFLLVVIQSWSHILGWNYTEATTSSFIPSSFLILCSESHGRHYNAISINLPTPTPANYNVISINL